MPGSRHYRFDGFSVDTQTREVRGGDGVPLALTAKAFDTLCLLIEHRDRVVGKEELLAGVWSGRVVEENNLTQAISTLRRAFGAGAGDHHYIVTVPGHGYRFVAEIDEGGAAEAAPAPTPGATGRRTVAVGALLFLLALFAIAAWRLRETPSPTPAGQPTALAVLPIRWLSPGTRDELLELGLADTLITRLSRSPALRVRSLASSQRLGGDAHDPVAAGRRLGAAYVVDGSAQQLADNVRVNVRLLSVADGATVWADTFDARNDNVFTLQDRISGAVVGALGLSPIVVPARSRSPCDGDDPKAYRAYLRGYYLLQRPSAANLTDALSAFRRAIDLDTACTRAYAGTALAYRGLVHVDREPGEMFALAKAAVAQALMIDPDSAEALMAQGRNRDLYDWDWAGAEASLKRAIALNPSLMEAHFAYAHLLVDLGRFDEGLAQARQARDLDPLSPMVNAIYAGFLTAARQPEAAGRQVRRALDLQPDFWIALQVRGGMALDRGDTAAAIADFDRAAERSHGASQILALQAIAHAQAGGRARAQAILQELLARRAAGYVPATSLAAAHVALGDTVAALDELERAYRERDIRMAFLKVDARWNPLRSQPRFRALAQRMGLAGDRGYSRL